MTSKKKEWILFEIGQIVKDDWYRFAIILKETNELIGTGLIYYEEEVKDWDFNTKKIYLMNVIMVQYIETGFNIDYIYNPPQDSPLILFYQINNCHQYNQEFLSYMFLLNLEFQTNTL